MRYFLLQIEVDDEMEYSEIGRLLRDTSRHIDNLRNTDDEADGASIFDSTDIRVGAWWFSPQPFKGQKRMPEPPAQPASPEPPADMVVFDIAVAQSYVIAGWTLKAVGIDPANINSGDTMAYLLTRPRGN